MLGSFRAASLNEIRVNRLLHRQPPPIPIARLVSSSVRERSLTFEAVDGDPLGPKHPVSLADRDVADLVDLALALEPYRPRRRWFRRFDLDRRLGHHVAEQLVSQSDAEALQALARRTRLRYRFTHADITARNVLRDRTGRLVLIDWEWAGLYPAGWELAFLWFSLADVPGARAVVERAVPRWDEPHFLLSAVLIHLLHLHLWRNKPNPFLPRHQAVLHELLQRVQ